MLRLKFLGAAVVDNTLGDRQIRVVANSGRSDRVQDRLFASGCKLDNYLANNIVVDGHDPSRPVGNFAPQIVGDALVGVLTFAPKGASQRADELCALYKAGVMRAVSVGFNPIESTPNKDGGYDFKRWELLELSCVSVPCDPGAIVTARSLRSNSQPGLSPAVLARVEELTKCLRRAESAHVSGLDWLERSAKHRAAAWRQARAIANGDSGGDDDDPGNDPGDNVELAARARRKRLIAIAARAQPRNPEAERRARLIEIASRVSA